MRTPLMSSSYSAGVIKDIITALTENEHKRLKKFSETIVNKHCEFLPGTQGFYYEGRVFTNVEGVPFASLRKSPPAREIVPDLREYSKQLALVNREEEKLTQGLAMLLADARTEQEIRDSLPEPLIKAVLPNLVHRVKRIHDEAYLIAADARKMRQYEKFKDILFFHIGNRLLV